MGKWIAFNLRPHKSKSTNRRDLWEDVIRSVKGEALIDLQSRIEAWLRENQTHSTRCYAVHGEDDPKRGKSMTLFGPSFPYTEYLRVKFRSARDATIFKLYFSEYMFTPVHNPKIRQTIEVLLSNTLSQTITEEINKEIIRSITEAVGIPSRMMPKPSYGSSLSDILAPVKIATVQRV